MKAKGEGAALFFMLAKRPKIAYITVAVKIYVGKVKEMVDINEFLEYNSFSRTAVTKNHNADNSGI